MISSSNFFRYGIYESSDQEFTWGKSIIFVLSALTMRGWSVVPDKMSGRVAFAVLFYASILLYYHWEAMLISYLATRVIGTVKHLLFSFIDRLVARCTKSIIWLYWKLLQLIVAILIDPK